MRYQLDTDAASRAFAPAEPEQAASAAGLRYVTGDEPGIRRRRCGRGFAYYHPDGELVRDPKTRERLERLAIPPAWQQVWICPRPDGHLQATGRDQRGRKQYRYHPDWRELRDATKFSRMVAFGEALPALRERVVLDLQRRGLPREKVLATVVRLLDTTSIRIGNEEYRRQNGSFGLTTLRRRHVAIDGHTLFFRFTGKGGKRQRVLLSDRRLARILRDCQEIPGYELFQYLDAEGSRHAVDSADINDYLRTAGAGDFTAKDFRTWMGSVLALRELRSSGSPASDAEAQRRLVEVVDSVAERLGNSRATCRQFYIHPSLFEGFQEGWLCERLAEMSPGTREGLSEEEGLLLELLRGDRSSRRRR